jgi:purine-binding chemotaxis protein CheW
MPQSTSTVGQKPQAGGEFLTFFLDDDEYGFEILKVQEIIGMMSVTPVPRTPPFVQGVINLRGKVIPIIDLRMKFAMPAVAQTEETCIIVVRAQGIAMGIVVDKVSEVLDMATEDIDVLCCGAAVNTDYMLGIGKAPVKSPCSWISIQSFRPMRCWHCLPPPWKGSMLRHLDTHGAVTARAMA